MTNAKPRYRVSVWHGEAKSLFYLLDAKRDEIFVTESNKRIADQIADLMNQHEKRKGQ